jgi:MFS family permease
VTAEAPRTWRWASRPWLDALNDPRYRRLWLGGLCANTARWVDLLTVGWLALQLTGSPVLVGLVAFARSLPMMALGPLAGVVADRIPRTRIMIVVQAANVLLAAALAGLFGGPRGTFGVLLLLELVLGVAWALDFPARRTLLSTLVEPRRLTNAISLDNVSNQVSKFLGPAGAGLLLGQMGPRGCYVLMALLSLVALAATRALDRIAPPMTPGPSLPVLASLTAGLREARGHSSVKAVLAVTLVMNTLVFPYQHLLAVFAQDVLLVGPERLGLLASVNGLGALAGSVFLATRRDFAQHAALFVGASVMGAVLVVGFALSPWYLLSLTIQLLFGLIEAAFGTMQSTIVLLATPEAARGRVMGILSACIGTQPAGTLWLGFLASLVGAPIATALGAGVALGLMLPVAGRLASRAGQATAAALR